MRVAWRCFGVTSALLVGCGGGSSGPKALPELTAAPLTTEQTIALVHATTTEPDLIPSDPNNLAMLLSQGFGETQPAAGEAIASHTLDGSAAPAPSASPTLITRFVHLADIQLSDDESPGRVVDLETMGATYAAYRPQEAWVCRMLNAAVRTINKVDEAFPVEFVVQGGDNGDNSQTNEEAWFRAIMSGAPSVECDSGEDDDPVKGANNDPKDPFVAEGLHMPWKWVTGNHDVLEQGNIALDQALSDYTGTKADFGTIDWSKKTPVVTSGVVIADPERVALDRKGLMQALASDGDGHGIGAEQVASGKAYYHFDVASGQVRIIVMDTAAETGGADGVLHRADLMQYVKPALDEAEQQGKYVILMSHHGAPTLTVGDDVGGTMQADAVLAEELHDFLAGYPHVMLHLGAHTHLFRWGTASPTAPATGHTYFEAETDSLADWPGEFRMFEIWDQGNYIEIRGTPVDFSDENDPIVTEARRRQAAQYTSGWVDMTVGPGPADARGVSLWFPKVKS